jgi:hypothetical protein
VNIAKVEKWKNDDNKLLMSILGLWDEGSA